MPRDTEGATAPEDAPNLTPEQTLALADDLLATARPFAAHEVLETAWHTATSDERDLWQGLAQLAVGLTHRQRGNVTGAVALLRRGSERLSAYAGTTPYGVGIDRLRRAAEKLAQTIEAGTDADPSVQLRG